ncbi:hypothetical protein HYDPIDRAFT_153126, partial [Hydnomerulius pinastri MD-312]
MPLRKKSVSQAPYHSVARSPNLRHTNLAPLRRPRWRPRTMVVLLFSVIYLFWQATRTNRVPLISDEVIPRQPQGIDETLALDDSELPDAPPSLNEELSAAIHDAPSVCKHSLTVILPVIPETLSVLEETLAPFLISSDVLYEVAVICPDPLLLETRRALRSMLSMAPYEHSDVSVYPWYGLVNHHQAVLAAVPRSKTEWTLLLDENGFQKIAESDRAYLLNPRALSFPVGSLGFTDLSSNSSLLPRTVQFQPAAYLIPPFVAQSSLLAGVPPPSHPSLIWSALGEYVAQSRLDMIGGVVIGRTDLNRISRHSREAISDGLSEDQLAKNEVDGYSDTDALPIGAPGVFALAFPHNEDLKNFMSVVCKLQRRGYAMFAFLYGTLDTDSIFSDVLDESGCVVDYIWRSDDISTFSDWLDSLPSVPDVVIGLDHQDFTSATFLLTLERRPYLNTTLIRLPRADLPYSEWMGTLTLQELRHWNVPEITMTVITNDRPQSLQRLLTSIQSTLFYGDRITLRINMEQTSDPETMRLVEELDWDHGDVFVHHRVIHGGLLPAVVESWYPHCNDSYSLLLEDDIELSPLSYAWAKMALLRYRCIPCSWGALYFPSHWREFHDYLSIRLSQHAFPISTTVVPGVRSNKWTKSWKKYFIELVYLRGYVMLYANYEDFVSFSTNHLEVGSHVRD